MKGGVARVAGEQKEVFRGLKKEGVLGIGGVIMGLVVQVAEGVFVSDSGGQE